MRVYNLVKVDARRCAKHTKGQQLTFGFGALFDLFAPVFVQHKVTVGVCLVTVEVAYRIFVHLRDLVVHAKQRLFGEVAHVVACLIVGNHVRCNDKDTCRHGAEYYQQPEHHAKDKCYYFAHNSISLFFADKAAC